MRRVYLLSWNAAEVCARAAAIQNAGWEVSEGAAPGPPLLGALAQDPPAAVVIDLDRRPSVGRDVAVTLRCRKGTRAIPLVFAGGDPEKVAGIRSLLPDAVYTGWEGIAGALASAVADPPTDPVVPSSVFAGYEGAPLPKKLGIKPGSTVALLGAPEGFAAALGDLPEGVTFRDDEGPCALTLWFVRSPGEVERDIAWACAQAECGPVWVVWAKKGTAADGGVIQQHVRRVGLAAGLVDYKVCSIDQTWTGLLFRRRK